MLQSKTTTCEDLFLFFIALIVTNILFCFSELRYNKGSNGCTVDLLSKNELNDNTIKFTTGVRGHGGRLHKCLDDNLNFDKSRNNILPFVYSVNNKDIEKLNNGQHRNDTACSVNTTCDRMMSKCMPWTSLEVSWSRAMGQVYAFTHLVGEVVDQRVTQYQPMDEQRSNMTFDLTINSASAFTMNFSKPELFNAADNAVCVPKDTQIANPETWTITNDGEELIDKRLLVFSLLRQNATFVYTDGGKIGGHPNGPDCELFVRFATTDYSLLVVNTSATTTPPTTTTTAATTGAPTTEPPETTTDFSTSSLTTTAATKYSSIRTTSQAATKCPEQREECGGAPYLAIGIAAAGLFVGIVIAVLVWLWMKNKAGKNKKKGGKQDAERAEEERLLALYKAEEKAKGKKVVGTFAAWKKNRKELKSAVELPSIENEIAAIWKKVEKKKAMDKMQYLVDQFEKQKEKELFEREYKPELKKKGLAAVGSFEEWKKNKNIAATFTLDDGTRTAIEYEQPKVIEKIVEVERVIIEKADEWTIEENPTIEEQERLAEIKAANRGAVDGVEVPMSEEEPEPVDERWIPPSEPNNNNPREEI
uniref:Uncharacterized protein n=1 Tax=Meloidogyne enterolobii TaxID=390850 RepID=A0A6V7VT99_MELEN|nr:unnamed protein product [Meloidogyne enterolobii]